VAVTELDQQRLKYIQKNAFDRAIKLFEKHSSVKTVALYVAQYWDDQVIDEVHGRMIVCSKKWSDINDEDLKGAEYLDERDDLDRALKHGIPFYNYETRMEMDYEPAIVLFQPFCIEGSQNDNFYDNYRPYCVWTKDNGTIDFTVVGDMIRPQLEGAQRDEDN
jgi:hypothetical protein